MKEKINEITTTNQELTKRLKQNSEEISKLLYVNYY